MNRWHRIVDRPDISVSEEMVLAAVTYGAHQILAVVSMTGASYGVAGDTLRKLCRLGYVFRARRGYYKAVQPHNWPCVEKPSQALQSPPPSILRPLTPAEKMGAHVPRIPLAFVSVPSIQSDGRG